MRAPLLGIYSWVRIEEREQRSQGFNIVMGYVDILDRINHIPHEAQNHKAQNSAAERLTEHAIGNFWSASPCKKKKDKKNKNNNNTELIPAW